MSAPNIKAELASKIDTLGAVLRDNPMLYLLPPQGDEPAHILHTASGLLYPPDSKLQQVLRDHAFLFITNRQGQTLATMQTNPQTLWVNGSDKGRLSLEQARAFTQNGNWLGLNQWKLPTNNDLWTFATAPQNPHRSGREYRLHRENYWMVASGRVNTDNGYWDIRDSVGSVFAFGNYLVGKSAVQICNFLADNQYVLANTGHGIEYAPSDVGRLDYGGDAERLMWALTKSGMRIKTPQQNGKIYQYAPHPLLDSYAQMDYTVARLPKLEPAQLTDPHKGLWEFWGEDGKLLQDIGVVARNPALDVKDYPVAIDFGTSSTVVALREGNTPTLLRIGAKDFYAPITAQQFENPTAIEILDYAAFNKEWTATTYRPNTQWQHLRVGHEPLNSYRDNTGDTQTLARMFLKMKQWALRAQNDTRQKITDHQGVSLALAPLTLRTPVKGQAMQVSADDDFDPVEVYAWQLGMVINWRGRGIMSKYYLSFPVKYEQSVKDKIKASFARGLQRSFPANLVSQGSILSQFEVQELASEPAAYAAAALPYIGLQPSNEGLRYAVFDFGGGTTDFDFGLWRWANAQEEAKGYQSVFEHRASSGDNFLGGENLLENLAYRIFVSNLDALRSARIHFTKPLDAQGDPAAQAFIQPTQAAQTNTILLIGKLRGYLESSNGCLDSQMSVDLLSVDGNKTPVTLIIDQSALEAYLQSRVEEGVLLFMQELARAFANSTDINPIHILLAGNGSRSRHVTAAFNMQEQLWGQILAKVWPNQDFPALTVHPPLPIDDNNPYAPTAKTGVALGLLKLVPGSGVRVINEVRESRGSEAPFKFFVGRGYRGNFKASINPDTLYGIATEVGPIAQGVFNLRYTVSLRGRINMTESDPELHLKRLDYPDAADGHKLWIKPLSPTMIALAVSGPASAPQDADFLHTLDLSQ